MTIFIKSSAMMKCKFFRRPSEKRFSVFKSLVHVSIVTILLSMGTLPLNPLNCTIYDRAGFVKRKVQSAVS